MAFCIHHVAVAFVLLFSFFLSTKANVPENRMEKALSLDTSFLKNHVLMGDKMANLLFERPFRSVKELSPRTTRIGESLYAARGYGKRQTMLPLSVARLFGKRNQEKPNSFLCVITKCRNFSSITDDGFARVLQNQDKELPREAVLGED